MNTVAESPSAKTEYIIFIMKRHSRLKNINEYKNEYKNTQIVQLIY